MKRVIGVIGDSWLAECFVREEIATDLRCQPG
jgi:hypothetical protein